MKPPVFAYRAPTSVAEAVTLLTEYGLEAKVLAGGQSLLPVMKLRLARPTVLVDLNRIPGLDYVREESGQLVVGAMTRTGDLVESELVANRLPVLAEGARHVGHIAIRNRGTVGGSLAHADPAAELPMVALALGASMTAQGPGGTRSIPAREFFLPFFGTALSPDEILTEIRFPLLSQGAGWSFQELSRRSGDFAMAAVTAVVEKGAGGVVARAAIALCGVSDSALRAEAAELALAGRQGDAAAFAAAADKAVVDLDPPSDVHGSGEFRRTVARSLVQRALAQAWERCR